MKNKFYLFIILSIAIVACKDNSVTPDNPPSNEGELITSLHVILKDSASGSTQSFVFKDSDGEGGNAPERFDSIYLQSNHTYECQLLYLDESKSETDTISNEIIEEAEDHLIYFEVSGANMNIQITDKDINNLPLGLQSKWRTEAKGEGNVQIVLKHQPGLKDGSLDKGETDASINFKVLIE